MYNKKTSWHNNSNLSPKKKNTQSYLVTTASFSGTAIYAQNHTLLNNQTQLNLTDTRHVANPNWLHVSLTIQIHPRNHAHNSAKPQDPIPRNPKDTRKKKKKKKNKRRTLYYQHNHNTQTLSINAFSFFSDLMVVSFRLGSRK